MFVIACLFLFFKESFKSGLLEFVKSVQCIILIKLQIMMPNKQYSVCIFLRSEMLTTLYFFEEYSLFKSVVFVSICSNSVYKRNIVNIVNITI